MEAEITGNKINYTIANKIYKILANYIFTFTSAPDCMLLCVLLICIETSYVYIQTVNALKKPYPILHKGPLALFDIQPS